MRPRKRILYQKLCLSWSFVYIAYMEIISMSREVALPHFSAISPHTYHYNACSNKELSLSKEEKFYFSNRGRTNRLPRITVYILRHATRAVSFTFILLLLIVLQICPSFIRLICTQTIPKHKEVPRLTEKIELICISDQRVSICAIP